MANRLGPFQKRRTKHGMTVREEINKLNQSYFIGEHPKRIAAFLKQNRDLNARRARAHARKRKGTL
jgi:hypothetical protein